MGLFYAEKDRFIHSNCLIWKNILGYFSRIRQYSTEFSEKLQYFTPFYNHKQSSLIISNIKWNISSNLSYFEDKQFLSCFFHKIWAPVWNFYLMFSNSNLKLHKFNVAVTSLALAPANTSKYYIGVNAIFSVQVTYRDFKNAQQNLMCKWVFNYKNPPQLKIRRRAPQIYQNATLAN